MSRPRPYTYQQRAIRQVATGNRGLIELPYGTGKTMVAIRATESMWARSTASPPHMAVFCKNRNVLTWRRELEKWLRPVYPLMVIREWASVPKEHRADLASNFGALAAGGLVYIIPHQHIARDESEIVDALTKHHVSSLIMDESTAIKNPKAAITKAAARISRALPHAHKLALTGNSTPEGPHEIWGQLDWTMPNRCPLGHTYYEFLRRWFIRHDHGWTLAHDLQDKFWAVVVANSIQLTAQQKRDLVISTGMPTQQYVIEFYNESREQRNLLDMLFGEWALPNDAGQMDEYSYTMAIMQKAQQICGGFYYDAQHRPIFLNECPKAGLLQDVVSDLLTEAPARKIVVWHKYKPERDIIRTALSGRILEGPDEVALKAFMGNPHEHLILMPVDCCHGLNELMLADINIFYSNDFSQEKRNQAEARLVRLGSSHRTVTHIDLCSPSQRDIEVVTALQGKSMTPERLATIVRKEHMNRSHV